MNQAARARSVTDREYGAYRSLYGGLRRSHPQRMELSRHELERALNDDRTTCDTVAIDGIELRVPQLLPVEINEWLNAEYYARQFPEAARAGRLLHLTACPGRPLGAEATDRLLELLPDGVTLVVDGPPTGEWSVHETLARLAAAMPAGALGRPELLGTQTYWSGLPINVHMEPLRSPGSLSDAARRTGRDALPGGDRTGAFVRHSLDDSEVRALFDLYSSAYAALADHPCAQGVTPEKFREMMVDDPEMTKVVFQRDGVVESICLITSDLSSLDWINLEFYRGRFGDALDHRGAHWYPAIATRPDSTGARNAEALMDLLGDLYENARNRAEILFDTPDMNSAFLPAYLEELINALPHYEVRFEVIAEHEYHAVELRR